MKSSWSLVGLASLIGMLLPDLVFDFGHDRQAMKSYYCTLLPTIFSFPGCLRVAIPTVFTGVMILAGVFRHATSDTLGNFAAFAWHMVTCFLLILGGIPSFAYSLLTVMAMCNEGVNDLSVSQSWLQMAHAWMAGVFLLATLTELLAARAAPAEPDVATNTRGPGKAVPAAVESKKKA